jgi:hypothetical protein
VERVEERLEARPLARMGKAARPRHRQKQDFDFLPFNTTIPSPTTNVLGRADTQLIFIYLCKTTQLQRCPKKSSTTSRIEGTTHCGVAGFSSLHIGQKDHGSKKSKSADLS